MTDTPNKRLHLLIVSRGAELLSVDLRVIRMALTLQRWSDVCSLLLQSDIVPLSPTLDRRAAVHHAEVRIVLYTKHSGMQQR